VQRGVVVTLAVVALLASACSNLQNLDQTVKASCSVLGNDRFDLSYTDGPDLTPDEMLDTPQGETLDAFFNGGPGWVEGGGYLEADGFSIVSNRYVLGYRDGQPISDFHLDGDDVEAGGGCRPVLVRGDQAASRWHLSSPADPDAKEIAILVEGGACVEQDGTRITTEIVEIVVENDDPVLITAWTREVNPPAWCSGIGITLEAKAVLDLPLGDRKFLDGGLIPPANIQNQP
jgi:hypothetical protein